MCGCVCACVQSSDWRYIMYNEFLSCRVWRPVPEDDFATHLRYLRGFIQLQDMIDNAIIKLQTGNYSSRPTIDIQQFPYPCHKEDQ